MFLSRVELRVAAASKAAFWKEVSTPYGAHQALWRLFSLGPSAPRTFLFRHEERLGRPSFLTLSAQPPIGDGAGLWSIETRDFRPVLVRGQRLRFALRASPVVRRGSGENGAGRSKRHDVVMDAKLRQRRTAGSPVDLNQLVQESGSTWLRSQGEKSGFRLCEEVGDTLGDDGLLDAGTEKKLAVRIDGYRQHRLRRGHGSKGEASIRFSSLEFEGVLEVLDPGLLLAAVTRGFGPQKAFGCGLMLLRRA